MHILVHTYAHIHPSAHALRCILPAVTRALRYKRLGRLAKPKPPYRCEPAAKAPRGALGAARVSSGALPLLDSHAVQACLLFPHLCASGALWNFNFEGGLGAPPFFASGCVMYIQIDRAMLARDAGA